ncbi:MAG TPA: 2-isopropylmalate synthase [Actinomycetes bacterium]|nr:2-isopropylmalate synthase [Actinomycetes bacterium]
MSERVTIFDTTLRDGEQAPGINLNATAKVEIAEQLARLGVDVVEAGFPQASVGDFEAVRAVAERVRGPVIAALARAHVDDVDRAADALAPAERMRIHTFIATSPIHMEHKLRMTPAQVLARAEQAVARARTHTADVEFSAEDATRSDPEFLKEVYAAAIAAGATTCNVPDTVGYMLPDQFAELVGWLRAEVPGAGGVTWSVHCHDDLGVSVASSIAAVKAGARQVEVAVNGIGERAGNCSMEEVAMVLRTHASTMGFATDVDTREIARTSRLVSLLTGYPVQPNKSVVGANAFAHESGIHQHGVLANRLTYEIMDPRELGYAGSKIVLGKHSGRHAVADALAKLGFDLKPEELDRAFDRFKEVADRKARVTDSDLEAVVADTVMTDDQTFVLVGLQVAGGTSLSPTATVRVTREGAVLEESAMGDGMVDAACNAIARATGVHAELVDFHVSSVTGGTDALGDVTVQVEIDGERVTGRGVAADVVEASARAYLAAVNGFVRTSPRPVGMRAEPEQPEGGEGR